MASPIQEFRGFRAVGVAPSFNRATLVSNPALASRPRRCRLTVESFKKRTKTKQLILLEDVEKLGKKGDLVTVAMGYWRNYLNPFNKAKPATDEILNAIRAEAEAEEKRKREIKNRSERLAVALKTIGRFVIKKKSAQGGTIFGSVSAQDVVDVVYQQTAQELDKGSIVLPEIRELGSYEISVKLHPGVTGNFTLIVAQEKNVSGRR